MIAVDTSALVAIVLGEVGAESLVEAMTSDRTVVSAVSVVEASIVVEARQGPDAARDLELLIDGAVDEVRPVDRATVAAAVDAWRRFGKGRHPASLNFGDCFTYALASVEDLPLLFLGEDFTRTDLRVVS